jgi:hypothetical protein
MVDHAGAGVLARRHPLTFEGEDIGSFDLIVACGASGSYDMSYIEHRHDGGRVLVPARLGDVSVSIGGLSAALKVVSSERRASPDELVTFASGPAPAALVDAFAAIGNHSMMIETRSAGDKSARLVTGIRIGNTGAEQNLPHLSASCSKMPGDSASLTVRKTGGYASAK